MPAKPKRPRDPVQLAKLIGDIATGQVVEADAAAGTNPAAVERGHKGGIKGGTARAMALSPTERSKIAKKAATARWSRRRP